MEVGVASVASVGEFQRAVGVDEAEGPQIMRVAVLGGEGNRVVEVGDTLAVGTVGVVEAEGAAPPLAAPLCPQSLSFFLFFF